MVGSDSCSRVIGVCYLVGVGSLFGEDSVRSVSMRRQFPSESAGWFADGVSGYED